MLPDPEPNPGLDRVRYSLRAIGIPSAPSNPLRSGIHNRGYLPHVKREGASYFITFRLDDALPKSVLLELRQRAAEKLRGLAKTDTAQSSIDLELQRQIERYLDRGGGACYLRRPDIATMVAESLRYGHDKEYLLDEWVIMPNHVHIVLWPMPNYTLSRILQSRKRHTARQANLILSRTGESFWQPESYDHWIRNEDEKIKIRRYIRNNPVTAGLCVRPEDFPWSSAYLAPIR